MELGLTHTFIDKLLKYLLQEILFIMSEPKKKKELTLWMDFPLSGLTVI